MNLAVLLLVLYFELSPSLNTVGVPDLVDASASALQDDDLQEFGSVTLCVLAGIYCQHLQQVQKVRLHSLKVYGGGTAEHLTFLHMLYMTSRCLGLDRSTSVSTVT